MFHRKVLIRREKLGKVRKFDKHTYTQGASLRGRPTPPATLAHEGKKYIKLCEANKDPRLNLVFLMIVTANRRLDNAKSPAAILQEKTAPTPARTPHTLRVADVVRTYIPQVGYYDSVSSFDMLSYVCTRIYQVRKQRKHSRVQQHSKNNENETENLERQKIPVPSRVTIFCLIGTPYTRSKE